MHDKADGSACFWFFFQSLSVGVDWSSACMTWVSFAEPSARCPGLSWRWGSLATDTSEHRETCRGCWRQGMNSDRNARVRHARHRHAVLSFCIVGIRSHKTYVVEHDGEKEYWIVSLFLLSRNSNLRLPTHPFTPSLLILRLSHKHLRCQFVYPPSLSVCPPSEQAWLRMGLISRSSSACLL